MLVDGGRFGGRRLLREETLRLMFTDQLHGAGGDLRFGLGFAIKDVELGTGAERRKAVEYSWGGYASTAFRVVPEARLIQVVLRQYVPSKDDLSTRLIATVDEGVGR
jgi:CubicO group peptidase (beta-lactamase class C family)